MDEEQPYTKEYASSWPTIKNRRKVHSLLRLTDKRTYDVKYNEEYQNALV